MQKVQELSRHNSGAGIYSYRECLPYNARASYLICGIYFAIYAIFCIASIMSSNWTLIVSAACGLALSFALVMRLRKILIIQLAKRAGVLFINPRVPLENKARLGFLGDITEDEAGILSAYIEENYEEWFELKDKAVDFDNQFDIILGTVTDVDRAKDGVQQKLEVEYCGRRGYSGFLLYTWDGRQYEKGDSVHIVYYTPKDAKEKGIVRIVDMQSLRDKRWNAELIREP